MPLGPDRSLVTFPVQHQHTLQEMLLLLSLLLLAPPESALAARQQEPSQLLASFFPATDDRVQWVGRVVRDEQRSRVTFDWPGVQARFGLQGASAVEVLIDDSTPTGTLFSVSLDGPDGEFQRQHVQTILSRRGVHSYPLASGEVLAAAGNVAVSLLHTQEARFIEAGPSSNVTVLGFATDGSLQGKGGGGGGGGPERLPRRLEIIGDSITAGYGAAATVVPCEASIFTNDHSLTYAHLLCKSLGAECFVEAFSGVGMYRSYPDPGVNMTMPERFQDTLAGVPGAFPWRAGLDGGGWVPHAVMIALGTNDFQPGSEDDPAFVSAFVDAYVGFVTTLADTYAQAAADDPPAGGPPVFFLAVGPMRMTYAAAVREVLKRLADGKGETKIEAHYVDLGLDSGFDQGCHRHPAASAHKAMADKAGPAIAQAMRWAD